MSVALMIRFTTAMVVLHILQILLWAGSYRWLCLPSWESAFYFSATSYSTVGYGDIVLPKVWRTLGPIESVIGVLMCGISVSALFAIATRLVEAGDPEPRENQSVTTAIPVPEAEFVNSEKTAMPLRTSS